jgi:hypothetical protein
MAIGEVKIGTRLIYRLGKQQFPALALSAARPSVHAGTKHTSLHVNLVYVSENGVPVTVMAAPVAVTALSDDELEDLASIEYAARARDHRRPTLDQGGGNITRADIARELFDAHQHAAWRTEDGDWRAKAEALSAEVDEYRYKLNDALAVAAGVPDDPSAANEAPANLPSAEDLDAAAKEAEAAAATSAQPEASAQPEMIAQPDQRAQENAPDQGATQA